MIEKFKIKVNDSTTLDLTATEASELDTVKEPDNRFHILKHQKAYNAKLVHSDFGQKTYTIRVNSNTYKVKIENSLDQLIKKMGFSLGSSKKVNQIKAPMPGIILQVNVKEGDEVKEGDTLLILEAMKMENAILSPKDAVVKTVNISKGDTVDKNMLLIDLN